MKKLTLSLMALVCALCCAFALVACNEETPGDTSETTGGNETVTIAGKTFLFSEITSTNNAVSEESLEQATQMYTGATITFTADGEASITTKTNVDQETVISMTVKGIYTFENGSGTFMTKSMVVQGTEVDIPEDEQSTQTLTFSDGKLSLSGEGTTIVWVLQD